MGTSESRGELKHEKPGDASLARASIHQTQFFFKYPQHSPEFMTALHHPARAGDDGIGPLPPCGFRILLDSVKWRLGGAAEDREDPLLSRR